MYFVNRHAFKQGQRLGSIPTLQMPKQNTVFLTSFLNNFANGFECGPEISWCKIAVREDSLKSIEGNVCDPIVQKELVPVVNTEINFFSELLRKGAERGKFVEDCIHVRGIMVIDNGLHGLNYFFVGTDFGRYFEEKVSELEG